MIVRVNYLNCVGASFDIRCAPFNFKMNCGNVLQLFKDPNMYSYFFADPRFHERPIFPRKDTTSSIEEWVE